jgi:DNA replication protein DnaC
MGEYLDKWLPEMKSRQGSRLSNKMAYQSILQYHVCKECHSEYDATVTYFPEGSLVSSWSNNRSGLCPTCRKKQSATIDAEENGKAKGERDDRRERWRQSCGIPHKYLFKGFQQFDKSWQPRAFAIVKEYAENFPIAEPEGYKSLVLYSVKSWGTGKTHLACSVAHHILSRWNGETGICPVAFVSEPVLFKTIRETYSYSPMEKGTHSSESDIVNSLIRVPLLILDDLGKEDVADLRFVQRTLFAIIDGRYNLDLPVMVTANLDDAGLRTHLGGASENEASFNRLMEMCKNIMIRMDGASYRNKLAQEARG